MFLRLRYNVLKNLGSGFIEIIKFVNIPMKKMIACRKNKVFKHGGVNTCTVLKYSR